jgi:hypothetical protein
MFSPFQPEGLPEGFGPCRRRGAMLSPSSKNMVETFFTTFSGNSTPKKWFLTFKIFTPFIFFFC